MDKESVAALGTNSIFKRNVPRAQRTSPPLGSLHLDTPTAWVPRCKLTALERPEGKSLAFSKQADTINKATVEAVNKIFVEYNSPRRFVPYMSIHDFVTLLFSNPDILSEELNITIEDINSILANFSTPEAINNRPETAPAKRLEFLTDGRFHKTQKGIAIAEKIGIESMREKCFVFNEWLKRLESLEPSFRYLAKQEIVDGE